MQYFLAWSGRLLHSENERGRNDDLQQFLFAIMFLKQFWLFVLPVCVPCSAIL